MAEAAALPPDWRIVYLGTPDIAVPPLQALCRAGHDVVLVVTRPPRRRGRRQDPTPSPVAAAAAGLGLMVTHDLDEAVGVEANLGVVVAYGEHIPDEILERRRTVNLHFSLLPRWRGAAPVERAILAGDTETGVCLMDVASEIDAGAVYRRRSVAIRPDESVDELRDRLCELGTGLLLDALSEGFGEPVPQSGEMTWADKISPSELRIDWTAPAEHVLRLIRVGGAWTTLRDRRLKILKARLATDPGQTGVAGTISLGPRSGDGPVTAAPTGDSPVMEALTGDSPVMEALTGDSPVMEALTGDSPVMEALTGDSPVMEALTGDSPVMEALTGDSPVTEALTGDSPTGDSPAVKALTGDSPVMEALTGDSPAVKAATGRGPAVEVVAGRGGVELTTVQLEGRAPIPASDWVNGARIAGGERFE